MDELSVLFCAGLSLIILLTLVTLIGHGIWVLIAMIVRALSNPTRMQQRSSLRCAACGHPDAVRSGRCRFCGANVRPAARMSLVDDLDATLRQLRRFAQNGDISAEQHAQLQSLVAAQRLRAARVPTATSAPAEPSHSAARETQSQEDGAITFLPNETTPATSHTDAVPPIVRGDLDQRPIEQLDVVLAEVIHSPKPTPVAEPQARPAISASSARVAQSAEPPQVLVHHSPLTTHHSPPLAESAEPPRTLADLLQSFMQERNIHWGELISGLLIVGSAVGLVISLRQTLSEAIPYFPALLFMLGTALIHLAGNYTLRRWKLRATSRGVLIIATLLVPLNFLAAVVLAGVPENRFPVASPQYIAAVAIGLLAFGTMVYFASRALGAAGWWRLSLVVMGTSIGQLLINRLSLPTMSLGQAMSLMTIPVGCFLLAIAGEIASSSRVRRLNAGRVQRLLLLLGIATFSLLAPLGLLTTMSMQPLATLRSLAPALSLVAASVLAAGVLLHTRITTVRLIRFRVAGTAVAIIGALLLGGALVLAWPLPIELLVVGLLNCGALILLSVVFRAPWLHGAAVASLGCSYLVGVHLALGHLNVAEAELAREMTAALLTGDTAVALTVLAILIGAAGLLLNQLGRRAEGVHYLWSCAALSGCGVASAAAVGFFPGPGRDAALATPVFAVNAAALLILGAVLRREVVTWIGSGLLFVTLVHALMFNPVVEELAATWFLALVRPLPLAAIAHAVISVALAASLAYLPRLARKWNSSSLSEPPGSLALGLERSFIAPLCYGALITSLVSVSAVLLMLGQPLGERTAYAAAIAVVWLVVAVIGHHREIFVAFQVMATLAIALLTATIALHTEAWDGTATDAGVWPLIMAALALWCAAWSGLRVLVRNRWDGKALVLTPAPTVDQLLLGALVLSLAGMGWFAAAPGVCIELGLATPRMNLAWLIESPFHFRLWIALGCAALAILSSLRERLTWVSVAGSVLLAACLPPLLATRMADSQSVASALRWLCLVYVVACSAIYLGRRLLAKPLLPLIGQSPSGILELGDVNLTAIRRIGRELPLALGGAALLTLTCLAAAQVASGIPLGGPAEGSFFDRLGPSLSYAGPLAGLVVVLLAFAATERNAAFALTGSGVAQLAASLGYLLQLFTAGGTIDDVALVGLLQVNALSLACYSLVWLALRRWIEPVAADNGNGTVRALFEIQSCVTWVSVAAIAAWAIMVLLWQPGRGSTVLSSLGEPVSYVVLILALAAAVWRSRSWPRVALLHVAGSVAAVLCGLTAATVSKLGGANAWTAYHVFLVNCLVAAALGVIFTWIVNLDGRRWSERTSGPWRTLFSSSPQSRYWSLVFLAAGVFAALRVCLIDPVPWWSVAALVAASILIGAIGLIDRRMAYPYVSTLCAVVATVRTWDEFWNAVPWSSAPQMILYLAEALIAVVQISALFWLLVDLRRQRTNADEGEAGAMLEYFRVGSIAASGAMFFIASTCLAIATVDRGTPSAALLDISSVSGWATLALLAGLLAAALWDRAAQQSIAAIYVWGATFIALALNELSATVGLNEAGTVVSAALALAGYVALTGHLWRLGLDLAQAGNRIGIPGTVAGLQRTERWLPGVNLIIAAGIIVVDLFVVLAFDVRWMRYSAAFAPLLLAYGIGALAQERRRAALQFAALWAASLSAVFVAWADMEPSWQEIYVLERAVRLLLALAGSAATYIGIAAVVQFSRADWPTAFRRVAATSSLASVVVLIAILAMEAVWFIPGEGVPVRHDYQIVVVAVVLLGQIAALLAMALRPSWDPLKLPETSRMIYVYAAEAVAALLFAHFYLVKPDWFEGPLRQYWPYVVVAIAFAGAGVGELFQRYRVPVVAEPLQRTAAFLPLLPVLAFWLLADRQGLPLLSDEISYSALLVVVGLLYTMLGMLRKSLVSGLAAALAGNAALWMLLQDQGLSPFERPQFWLIPPALSVLVATHLNRQRLEASVTTSIRYACMLVIYVSSTAEIFLEGASGPLWPPVLLAGLAVVGAFVGLVLQIRAFLYLGTTFVFLAVVSMVWHAAQAIDHVWPWWAFGMGLGVLILAVFGLVELKRAEVLQLIARLRQWER